MSQIITKGIAPNAVIETKIRLSNEGWLRARNAANSADVNIFKLSADNETVFASQATRFTGNVIIANGQYFQARNQADTADVSLFRLNSSNQIEFGTSASYASVNGSTVALISTGQVNLYTGNTEVNAISTNGSPAVIRIHDADQSTPIGITVPAVVPSYWALTLPAAPPASNGQVFTGNTDGTTSWTTPGGGGSGMAPTAVNAATNINTNISNPGTAVFDGVTLTTGQTVLLWGQSTASQNGPYTFNTSSTPLVRTSDWDSSAEFPAGRPVFVIAGTLYAYTTFSLLASVPTLGTSAVSFVLSAFDNASVPTGLTPAVDNNSDVGSGSKQFSNGHIRLLNVNNIQAIDGALTLNAKNFGLSGYTQDETGGSNSAAVSFKSGDVVNGLSGDFTARVGIATGSGTRGKFIVEMRHMHIYGEVADQGNEQINLGRIGGEVASTGFVVQTAPGTSGNNSQALNLGSGNADGNSGGLNLSTGTGGTNGGHINIQPGGGASNDQFGQVNVTTYRTAFSSAGVIGLPTNAGNPTALTVYVAGDTFYNSTTNKPKYFNGTTWEYFDGGVSADWGKEFVLLSGTDITNQYFDIAQEARLNSVSAFAKGQPMGIEDAAEDYTLSYTGGAGGVTRVNFATNWATAGASELVAGDYLVFQYQY